MATKRNIKLTYLEEGILSILKEESTSIYGAVQAATEAAVEETTKYIRNLSREKFNPKHAPSNGRYYTGWTSYVKTGQISSQGIIYNKKYPGLPHLLEKGHALRQGGRANGKPHVSEAQEYINNTFEGYIKTYIELGGQVVRRTAWSKYGV